MQRHSYEVETKAANVAERESDSLAFQPAAEQRESWP